jgi:hypothetical protein
MKLGLRLLNPPRLGVLCLTLQSLSVATATAQPVEPAPPPPAAPAPAEPAAPEAPPVVAAEAPAAAPVEVAAAPEVTNDPELAPPAPPSVAPPAAPPGEPPLAEEVPPEEDLGPLNISFWSRADLTLNNGEDLDDQASNGQFELHASGKVYQSVSLTTNFVATYNPDIAGTVALLDGIIQIEPSEFFNVWLGRMLVPVDRSNFSGPWFMAPWYFPGFGFADGQVIAPREGPFGRNDGVTVWGQVGGGLFKYYAGAFDLYDRSASPLFSGRLSLHLLNPEPGFYGSSTFYGKDLLAIGVGFQSKKDGSVQLDAMGAPVASDDYTGFNADVLFEKDLGAAGVLDLEGAVYTFNGDYERTKAGWFGVASYLLPTEIGGGKLQPLVRVQQAIPDADADSTSTLIDAQLGFIVNAYATRFALGYRNGQAGDASTQTIYLGAQLQK